MCFHPNSELDGVHETEQRAHGTDQAPQSRKQEVSVYAEDKHAGEDNGGD
eukprot:CAMPEP_0167801184 /NCGR_PEP_ID=MMETSP0111_2-20121227/18249_1 /TAXON_ID=91324 /ORGANISM="Lotharella globosa, Strain CCCM811" /LENGTH=49 /DNA_ID=CAMNT_0007696733 /DNA_START=20 /DNA_END=169 /DNA_ORIENTATION=-